MNVGVELAAILGAYLLGSIPVGYLLVRRATGQDIRRLGSGNMGSTNVKRVAGKRVAAITQLLDMAKGLLPVGLYLYFTYDSGLSYQQNIATNLSLYYVALAAILGHDFTIFLKFKGGKGVNTTLGASVLLTPVAVFMAVAVYFIIKWLFKYVSLGSLFLAITLVVAQFIVAGVTPKLYYLVVCMLLILVLHRTNIKRLLHHEEFSP